MEFQVSFQRRKGGSGSIPVIGSDSVPTGNPSGATNQACLPSYGITGPVRRLALGVLGPSGSVDVDIYVFDDRTRGWFKLGTTLAVPANFLTPVYVPVVMQRTGWATGAVNIAIVPSVGSGSPGDGTWTFAIGSDAS